MGLKVEVWDGGKQIGLDRDRIIWTDRSRIEQRKDCEQKWFYNYLAGPEGRGVESAMESEDLVTGISVHFGLQGVVEAAIGKADPSIDWATTAHDAIMFKFETGELLIQGDESLATVVPEIAETLALEQAWLAYAFIWTFERRHLGPLLEKYEVLGLEEEIPWLLGTAEGYGLLDDWSFVMMSRLDGVVRSREDGKLYILEYKTSKEFDKQKLEEIQIDEQGAAQMLAAQARYGELPAGILYFYFLKDEKRIDKEFGYKRYNSWAIRPYCNHSGMGEPEAVNFAPEYYYTKEDGSEGRLGKGWKRIDIWDSIGVEAWLEMLDSGLVKPDQDRDWLGELVACPEPVEWKVEDLERWRRGVLRSEQRFAGQGSDYEAERRHRACWSFRTKCKYYTVCWEGKTVEDLLIEGRLRPRVANHPIEHGEETTE